MEFTLIVSRGRDPDKKSSRRDPEFYTGRVWADYLAETRGPDGGMRLSTVFHEPGSRSHWHTHGGGQLLIVLAGEGRVATRDGAAETVRAGDCAYFAPGELHWHGAGPDHVMHELAMGIGTVAWPEDRIVTDDQYSAGF